MRFIPAGAGNTNAGKPAYCMGAVHPRRRGEHAALAAHEFGLVGSSPQARGTPNVGHVAAVDQRFIPAGAGNTHTSGGRLPVVPVHPRRRGEHMHTGQISADQYGSSPQARGTRYNDQTPLWRSRFIPAGAGNTAPPCSRRFLLPVHPRRRGEHGTQVEENIKDLRFIPAGAGNTCSARVVFPYAAVHPRRRGEHAGFPDLFNATGGSSPQARGTPVSSPSSRTIRRFIPAGAGNTHHHQNGGVSRPVHPRRRGEHHDAGRRIAQALGSSPQARGTRR